ncbi:MAG: helix-turn-helix domain-containing protein [Oscillospiraceae bacterium]
MEAYKMMFIDFPDVVSVEQMCEMLNISPKMGYRLLKNNTIEHFKIGKTYKIAKLHILKYMKVINKSDA